MPQRIRDFGLAALALVAAFAALTLIDERVPEYIGDRLTALAEGRAFKAGTPVGNLMATVAANTAVDNVFVMAMLAVAVVLLILMVRT
jgi:hypothetical protein